MLSINKRQDGGGNMSTETYESDAIFEEELKDVEQVEENSVEDALEEVKKVPMQLNKSLRLQETIEGEEKTECVEDHTFTYYKNKEKNKEREGLTLWLTRILKIGLFIMLLPIISMLALTVLGIASVWMMGILGCIGCGMLGMMVTVFTATQLTPVLVALGIVASITIFSFGALLFLMGKIVIEYMISCIRYIKSKS